MCLKKIQENSNAIFVGVASTLLSAIFLGIFPGVIWLGIEYADFKNKINAHQEKISKLEDVIYNNYKSKLDEYPTVVEKVHTDKLSRNFLESKIPPENFPFVLGVLKNNDTQNAKEKLLKQGLISPEQLSKVFKNSPEKTTIEGTLR